jgi:hypothetical protein
MQKVLVLHLLEKVQSDELSKAYMDIAYKADKLLAYRVLEGMHLGYGGVIYDIAASFETDLEIDSLLSYAFDATNNIDYEWSENEGVTCTGISKRSTSVGDVILTEEGSYFVDKFGFTRLA